MIVKYASACMVVAFVLSKLHHLTVYYHMHSRTWHSARVLLDSEICTHAALRMSVGEFANCREAEAFVAISPVQRAVYSVAEEIHLCGNDRCAVLYMDVTERLPYLFALVLLLLALLGLKLARDYRYHGAVQQCASFRLPSYGNKKDD